MAAFRRLGAVALAAALLAGPALADDEAAPARPRIYRWIDENGVTHYTTDLDRVPRPLRSRLAEPQPMEAREVTPRAPVATPDPWVERNAGPPPRPAAPTPSDTTGSLGPQDDLGTAQTEVDTGPGGQAAAENRGRLDQLEVQIAELSADIAADEEVMKAWISDPSASDPKGPQAAQMREIGLRLPGMLAELKELRKERADLEGEP